MLEPFRTKQPEAAWWGSLTKQQRRLLLIGSCGLAGAYIAYRAYRSDTLQALIELRNYLTQGTESYARAYQLSSDCTSRIVQDLHSFLTSDADEVPQSLRQLAKLAQSKEFVDASSRLAAAAIRNTFSPAASLQDLSSEHESSTPSRTFLEQILDALSTEKGQNLVSLAVGMACRSGVQAAMETGGSNGASNSSWLEKLLDFGTTAPGEKLYSHCVGTFVREGTKVWMGSWGEGSNGWEEFLGSVCRPERALAVDRITRSVVNELIISYLKRARHGPRQELRNSKSALQKSSKHMSSNALSHEAHTADGYVVTIQPRQSSDPGCKPKDSANPEEGLSALSPDWTSALVEMSKHPEIRGMLLEMARSGIGEGVRTSMVTAKEMMFGGPPLHDSSPPHSSVALQQYSTRSLGIQLLCYFLPIMLVLMGIRAATV